MNELMSNFYLPKYAPLASIVQTMRKNNKSWETIKFAGGKNEEELNIFVEGFKAMGMLPDYTSSDLWIQFTEWAKRIEEEEVEFEKAPDRTILISENADNEAEIPSNPKSSWQLYKKKLETDGWSQESVKEIEKSTLSILKKLNQDTTQNGPVKGLIIGNVQSGKTANMAGLMAMAADHGWNMFIVLSGLIDNLRKQTEERLISDLNHPGTLTWQSMENPSRRPSISSHTQNLHLGPTDRNRYLTVCLKNKTRLENLLKWLYTDENKLRQMKILLIDDEADQAGINTYDTDGEERARINGLILELVNGKSDVEVRPKAMNYISYTATPYANVLNETSKESLYPKDFIGLLKTPREYFGPKEIFGLYETEDYSGLDIIRDISQEELNEIIDMHKGLRIELPETLKRAVIWFFCAAAVQRYWKYKKPVSMLIHTSQAQAHHKELSSSVEKWINDVSEQELLEHAKALYIEETARFQKRDFRIGYPKYGLKDEEIKDYPPFENIERHIVDLKKKVSHIELDQEGELSYHKGTHLCIDNCANNGFNNENMYVRLAYPEKDSPRVETDAPAFIIVGGSTLSRGLTIEGLVSTFFLRSTKQGDTLMQMGRWFGYRKGYELLPRIWMTEDTQNKFRFLASLENEMREDLKPFLLGASRPDEIGPRIKNSPQLSWLRITAKNRMQSAVETELDFSGVSNQTVVFKNDPEVLKNNINVTENFLNSIGKPDLTHDSAALLWKNVPFEEIRKKFFENFEFESSPVFDQIDAFSEWYEKIKEEEGFTGWNVIVSGRGKADDQTEGWTLQGYNIGKVTRTRKGKFSKEGKRISIGVLRNPSDLYRDFSPEQLKKIQAYEQADVSKLSKNTEEVHRFRNEVGLGKTPQLIIYRIDKNSKARTANEKIDEDSRRYDLKFTEDIIGISILVPGKKNKSLAKKLTVNISHIKEEEAEGEEQ